MEESKFGKQVIRKHSCDHDRADMRLKMGPSDSRETLGGPWGNDDTFTLTAGVVRAQCNRPSANHTPTSWAYRRRWQGVNSIMVGWMLSLVASLWVVPASAVFLEFQNCLSNSYQQSTPLRLQFIPKFFDAVFNAENIDHNMAVTVWGNVAGSDPEALVILPPANDTDYWQGNQTNLGGKILDLPEPDAVSPKLTTLFTRVNLLTYEPYSNSSAFCSEIHNGSCPLAPVFNANE